MKAHPIEVETINKLYLELSQFATAQTALEIELADALLESFKAIESAECISTQRLIKARAALKKFNDRLKRNQ